MTSHEHPNATLAREGAEAMERGDMAWFDEHTSDDVVWHVGGNNKLSGTYTGKQAVMEMFGRTAGGATFTVDNHDILANDDHTVILGTATVTLPDGESAEYRFVNVLHIKDGKTTEAWGMSENDAVTDPIWDKLAG
jgi:ketosteroid isomerase-like protein